MDSIPRMAGAPRLIKHSADDEETKAKPQKDDRPWWVKMFVGSQMIPQQVVYMPTAYRTTESSQTEYGAYLAMLKSTNWQLLYTVPAGKSFYITSVTLRSDQAEGYYSDVVIGPSGTAVIMIPQICKGSNGASEHLIFPTPVKFVQGTILSAKKSSSDYNTWITINGYLE
jgi:hypothetical protein